MTYLILYFGCKLDGFVADYSFMFMPLLFLYCE
jgi:hypothetical protein